MMTKDKRFQKTEYLIKKTFFEMVKNNEKITVSKIAERSNIDRKTFYLHYPSIESLYGSFTNDAEQLLIDELNRLDFKNSNDHIKTFIQAYKKIFISYKDIFSSINTNKIFSPYLESSKSMLSQYLNIGKNQKDIDHEIIYNIFAYDGLISFQQRFIQGELNLTIDQYFDECEKIFRAFSKLYAKRSK